ncbi:formyltetrahydrofolate deformylase [Flavobacterium algicola]|uniref:formyltetrahydrofolate deformylase n=1 Tax=Flavobacterium algicola TaxID=556529 RepID=UPI001EFEBCDC|nr:formyltetrahydrofolate deformylase [Flavobacterium algicola]MCG9791084.1 formyltetrahydrofolate deformylase [Flavobacterium algicola]
MENFTLLIHCNDQKGIVAAVTNFILKVEGNILYLDQHVVMEQKVFFMRLECELTNPKHTVASVKEDFSASIAKDFGMSWEFHNQGMKPRMAIFVSKYTHCLFDILGRYSSGELNIEIPLIISNHEDLRPIAEQFNIPFFHVPFSKDNKEEGEKRQIELLKEHGINFIVLARYMQIITPKLIALYENKIINIHHSFLPAFPGAKPYHSAFKRGVKIIGATSHYVTEELDEGPIIGQDISRVSHVESVEDFIMKGKDLERIVLARAIKLHTERKMMVYGNKTVVFY